MFKNKIFATTLAVALTASCVFAAQTVALAVFEIDRGGGLSGSCLAAGAVDRQLGHARLGVEHLQIFHTLQAHLGHGKLRVCRRRSVRLAVVGDLIVAGDVRRAHLGGDCLGSRTGSQRDVRRAVKVDPRRNERRRTGSRLNRQIAVLAVGAFRDDAQRIRAAQRSVDRGGRLDGDVCQNGKLDTAAVIAVQRQRELVILRIVPNPPSIAALIRLIGSKGVRITAHLYRCIQ